MGAGHVDRPSVPPHRRRNHQHVSVNVASRCDPAWVISYRPNCYAAVPEPETTRCCLPVWAARISRRVAEAELTASRLARSEVAQLVPAGDLHRAASVKTLAPVSAKAEAAIELISGLGPRYAAGRATCRNWHAVASACPPRWRSCPAGSPSTRSADESASAGPRRAGIPAAPRACLHRIERLRGAWRQRSRASQVIPPQARLVGPSGCCTCCDLAVAAARSARPARPRSDHRPEWRASVLVPSRRPDAGRSGDDLHDLGRVIISWPCDAAEQQPVMPDDRGLHQS